jgi:hypothetical protein
MGIDAGEDVHAHALIGNEAVALRRIDGKCALYRYAFMLKNLGELALQIFLSRPADLICGWPQVAAGDKNNLF